MNNNINMIKSAVAAVAAITVCFSCSDTWDDHYGEAGTLGSGETVWEAVSSDAKLTNFARVAKECGYDLTLSSSQAFTVFAPTDDNFTSQQADSVINVYKTSQQAGVQTDENPAIRQFLQNHISLYKNPVSSLTNDTIVMMNGKYQTLTSGAIGGESFNTSNTLCSNGLLFTVNGKISYFPNVFEYLGNDAELDSVYSFLSSHNVYEFQPDKSVAGGIVDGQTVYLDSVSILQNDLLKQIGELNSEDSTYWMLAPVNSVWEQKVAEYESYFTYAANVAKRDSMQYVNARLALIGGGVFSRTNNPDAAFRDSAVSTLATSYEMRRLTGEDRYYIYDRPFDAGGIFNGAEDIECSNGHVLKTSDYRIDKFDTFLQTIKIEAEYTSYQDTIVNAEEPLTVCEVSEGNPFYNKVSGNGYVDVVPSASDAKPQIMFNVPGVLSNVGYDIYVVFAPVLASDTLASADSRLPNLFRASTSYVKEDGNWTNDPARKNYETTPDVVDTVLVAENKSFSSCSVGLSEPQVKLTILSQVNPSQTSRYSRTMHIDCILFVPHDKNAAAEAKRKRY